VAIVESTEWTFAADAAKWMSLFLHGQTKSPFTDAKVEQRSSGIAAASGACNATGSRTRRGLMATYGF
jgi:hypothetical protein